MVGPPLVEDAAGSLFLTQASAAEGLRLISRIVDAVGGVVSVLADVGDRSHLPCPRRLGRTDLYFFVSNLA